MAKAKHRAEDEGAEPVSMLDLHDLERVLGGRLEALEERTRPPASPPPTPAPPAHPPASARRGGGGALLLLVLVVLGVLIAAGTRKVTP